MPITKAIVSSADPSQPAAHLDPSDLAFHRFIMGQIDRLPILEAEIASIKGGRDLWTAYLAQKYGNGQNLSVGRDGTIQRAPAANGTGG